MRTYSQFRKKKDKTAIGFVTAFGLNILFITACIWAIVEFVLYITKDNPFNWWSLVAAGVCIVLYMINLYKILSNNF